MNIIRLNTTAPDGFVKVNVPQGGEGGGSAIEYIKVEGQGAEVIEVGRNFACVMRKSSYIGPPIFLNALGGDDPNDGVYAVGVDFSAHYIIEGIRGNVLDIAEALGVKELLFSLPRLTKEEFYNLKVEE